MFERFTEKARGVVQLAQPEAERAGVRYVGTEHLLMAMLAKGDGMAYEALTRAGMTVERVRADAAKAIGRHGELGADDAAALKTIGIDLDAVVAHVEQSFGPGALNPPPVAKKRLFGFGAAHQGNTRQGTAHQDRRGWTTPAKKVLLSALREAQRLNNNYIGTEHLLLGLIREGECLGAKILMDAGISLTDLRAAVEADLHKAA